MSDEAYSLILAITCILYALVLYHRFRQGQALKRLKRLLEETPPAQQQPPPE